MLNYFFVLFKESYEGLGVSSVVKCSMPWFPSLTRRGEGKKEERDQLHNTQMSAHHITFALRKDREVSVSSYLCKSV